MPCGSATRIATHTPGPALPSFPALRWFRKTLLARLAAMAASGWGRRRQYTELLALDDRLLADMGSGLGPVRSLVMEKVF